MADNELINKIFARYEEKRQNAIKERRERINEVYSKVPRIREIDSEINARGMKNVNNILREPSKHDEYNKDLNENLKRLEDEKNALLEQYNIPKDFKKYKYECSLCSDTGHTPDGKLCSCFKQALADEAYNSSNIAELMKKNNFDTFNFDFYSKEKENYKESPFENIMWIYNRTKKFCDEFDTMDKSLLFYGTTGLGKTFLSCAAAKELIERGKNVIYVRSSKLFNMFEDYRFGRMKDRTLIDRLYDCDLLIIDDLGAEAANKFNDSILFDVFDERISRGKKLIISTNLDIKELGKTYSMRFVSRIMENFIVCRFYGEDIRYKAMQ